MTVITHMIIDTNSKSVFTSAVASDNAGNDYHIFRDVTGKWFDLDNGQQVFFAKSVKVEKV